MLCACLSVLPIQTLAACFEGSTPTYDDISTIEINRCQPVSKEQPCYYAEFWPLEEQNGYLVAYYLKDLKGKYVISDRQVWSRLVSALRDANFLKLRVPQSRTVIVHIDGPEVQIIVRQCNSYFAIRPGSYDSDSDAWRRYLALADNLTQIVTGLRWQQKSADVKIGDILGHLLPW
jgi:hypothetical protein